MKFYALLDENNKVLNISTADDSWDSTGWIEYTLENPAYINGDLYLGFFYAPQPYPSWSRDYGTWTPPVPYPTDLYMYDWDETIINWVAIGN